MINYICIKNTGYANWQKTVTPPDHVASTAKGHCLLKKLTLKTKHDCPSIGERPLEPVEPLQSDFAAVGTNYWFVWPEGNCPPDWAWFLQRFFSPFCHRWSFSSLSLSPLACLVGDTSFPAISPTWLHRYYLNWTKLDNAITEFNNEMHSADNWVLNLVILHYWHNLPILILCSALLHFLLLKALYK